MTRALGIWLAGWLGALLLGGGAAWAAGSPACAPAWGVALEGYPVTPARLAACREETGLAPRLVLFYLQWPAPGEVQAFPRASLEAITEAGAVPASPGSPCTWDPPARRRPSPSPTSWPGATTPTSVTSRARRRLGPAAPRAAGPRDELARYHWAVAPEAYGPESPAAFQRSTAGWWSFAAGKARNLRWVFSQRRVQPPSRWHGAAWNTAAATIRRRLRRRAGHGRLQLGHHPDPQRTAAEPLAGLAEISASCGGNF